MRQKRVYRPLTEAEKRYIDQLVREGFGDTMRNFSNSIKNGYNQFHDWMHNRNNQQQTNSNNQDSTNMSPWEAYTTDIANKNNERVPTTRSQGAQFRDWMFDRFTNGEYSKKKNAIMNQQMQNDFEVNGYSDRWIGMLLDNWGYRFKKNADGAHAGYAFLIWLNQVTGANQDTLNNFNTYYNKLLEINTKNGKRTEDMATVFKEWSARVPFNHRNAYKYVRDYYGKKPINGAGYKQYCAKNIDNNQQQQQENRNVNIDKIIKESINKVLMGII